MRFDAVKSEKSTVSCKKYGWQSRFNQGNKLCLAGVSRLSSMELGHERLTQHEGVLWLNDKRCPCCVDGSIGVGVWRPAGVAAYACPGRQRNGQPPCSHGPSIQRTAPKSNLGHA